jgi:hypothetical protein
MEATVHQCKDLNNHCNHCNIDGNVEEKVLETTSRVEPEELQEGCKENESSSHIFEQ